MIDYITAASLVIGLGGGFIAGRLTSGVATWKHLFDEAMEVNGRWREKCRLQGRQIAEYRAADHARHLQRKAAAKRAGEVSHANRLAREAEAAALTEQAHSRMAEIIGERAE